jgi:hypothetical protein
MSIPIEPIKEVQYRHVIALAANKPTVAVHNDSAAGLALMTF